jgi:CDGSH-type Zn-finger protein
MTEASITPYRNGPYLVRGPVRLLDQDGNEVEVTRRTIALCRCGKSRTRPFCDGTHKLIGFESESAPGGSPAPTTVRRRRAAAFGEVDE